ncbi:MAG: VWA domain-containing protein [Pyrinomonadaceae bacterium]
MNFNRNICSVLLLFLCALALSEASAQTSSHSWHREFPAAKSVEIVVHNTAGRVTIASDKANTHVTVSATSPDSAVREGEISASAAGGKVSVELKQKSATRRIDLTITVPAGAKIKVTSDSGAVDIQGSPASAEVLTDTGTIRADVPLDAVRLNWQWSVSKPRLFSDVALPQPKEKAGGLFVLKTKLGNQEAERDARIELNFTTRRGIMLLNVDPEMVPNDLRERPLTEAAKVIIRSGESSLVEAMRKVAPKLFGDYAMTLPPPRRPPTLIDGGTARPLATYVGPHQARINVNVTDRRGREVSGLSPADFTVWENDQARPVTAIVPATEPFNLVLLLDVSGSVTERIDFIRKAARNFLDTASPQDRIAIVSFRDDIKLVSDFTTDRRYLSQQLDKIDAGGATALYDSLGYVLVETLKPVRSQRTAVVILSDGDDNRSFVPFGALVDAILESGAQIYPLYIPSGLIPEGAITKPGATADPMRRRYLTVTTVADAEGRRLAEVSGGVYYPIRRLEELQQAYDDVVGQLRMSYTLTYDSALPAEAERHVKVRVGRENLAVRLSPAVALSVDK